jgi:hypothetical protein
MTRPAFAVGLAAVAALSVVAAIVLLGLSSSVAAVDRYGFRGAGAITATLSSAVGLAIAFRQPRNAIAWTFLATGVCGGVAELAGAYRDYALLARGGEISGGEWAAWVASWMWIPAATVPPAFLALLFPVGRLPSHRWRPIAWSVAVVILAWAGVMALAPGPLREAGDARNPISPFREGDFSFTDVVTIADAVYFPMLALCVGALIRRFRRSRGVERLQMKWLAYASAIVPIVLVFLPVLRSEKPYQIVTVLIGNVIPLAVAIAILRYRLYDIDLLIKRTLVYGSLTVALGFVYVAAIVLSQQLLRGFTAGSDVAVAGSTLLVVALFQPIRTRVQAIVDRRFYRARYDAARTIDAFSARLRGDVDLDSVRADLIAVIHDTIHPAHASVWLRSARR